ncbi:hypothetical protein DFH07DRAFT_940739 [Mycena maculata]|uniref:Uncharacterized protein n=1 Tax=Mycena maculata TaxID=230809 RepID=A0AAD7J6F4_9AGAR|nr:hypothetical protein DFH07DRAFT_940739 [Mycena maculata]
MTRSASPTGVVEFSYHFPLASTSALPSSGTSCTRTSSPRRSSPVRPQYVEDEEEYASYEYPSRRRGVTVPIPAIPSLHSYAAPQYPVYPYAAPFATPSSYEIESSCSSAVHHQHRKIKKARRASIESTGSSSSPASCSFTSSSASSPTASSPHDTEDDFEPELEEEAERGRTPSKPHLDLRRQWAALSLRVQFGVFRAKRRLRSRSRLSRSRSDDVTRLGMIRARAMPTYTYTDTNIGATGRKAHGIRPDPTEMPGAE